MRDKLKLLDDGKYHLFIGQISSKGVMSNDIDGLYYSYCLINLKHLDEDICDHVWVIPSVEFKYLKLKIKDEIQFQAKVAPYLKGYIDKTKDYGLVDLKDIVILSRKKFKRHFVRNIYNGMYAYVINQDGNKFELVYLSRAKKYPQVRTSQRYYKRTYGNNVIENIPLRKPIKKLGYMYIIPIIMTLPSSMFSKSLELKFHKMDGPTIRDAIRKSKRKSILEIINHQLT